MTLNDDEESVSLLHGGPGEAKRLTGAALAWRRLQVFGKRYIKHLLFVALVIVAAAERVILKICVDRMSNYTFFLSELIALLYVPIFGLAVLYRRRVSKVVTDSMTAFKKWRFGVMAIFDTIASVLVLIPASNVSGELMTLILQGVIPVTMVASILILKRRYLPTHYVGSLAIIAGIALDLIPKSLEHDSKTDSSHLSLYGSLLFLSALPMAGGAIYREKALKQEMDVYYLNFWVSIFQVLLGLPLAPAAYVMQKEGTQLSTLPTNIKYGFECFLLGRDNLAGDKCSEAGYVVLLYIVVNIIFNVLFTMVCQHGSALMVFVAMAIAVPISYFLFLWDVIQSPPLQVSAWGIAGLCVTLLGLAVYYVKPEPEPEAGPEAGLEAGPEAGSEAEPEPGAATPSH